MFDTSKPVLGIDIGKVLTEDTDGRSGLTVRPDYLNAPSSQNCFSSVNILYHCFSGQVCLVSKCGGRVQVKTRHWLAHNRFFESTGVNPNRVFF
jgi:hypothetical protein